MADPVWPKFLPGPSTRGFSGTPDDATVRTQMTQGPARQRQVQSEVPHRLSVQWVLSAEQFEVFEAWWRLEIAQGASWFLMGLPSASGIAQQRARFVGPYKYDWIRPDRAGESVSWQVSGTLEVMGRPVMARAKLATYL